MWPWEVGTKGWNCVHPANAAATTSAIFRCTTREEPETAERWRGAEFGIVLIPSGFERSIPSCYDEFVFACAARLCRLISPCIPWTVRKIGLNALSDAGSVCSASFAAPWSLKLPYNTVSEGFCLAVVR